MSGRFKVKSWWWYRPGRWSGLLPSRGGDELGRCAITTDAPCAVHDPEWMDA